MPLFGNKPVPAAHIVPTGAVPLSKDQKTFNGLIKKIEGRRARLGEWESAVPLFRQKVVSELLPLQEQCLDLQSQLARSFDAAHERKGTTKGEQRKLAAMIVELAEVVLAHRDDGALKELFGKYGQSDYDEDEAARLEGMRAMLESALGMELGDDVDMTSPEDVLKRLETRFFEEQEVQADREATRKKSRREEARAAQREAEEKQLSQSIRDVFRKLASALHPDREHDPAEKARKTALMQRANDAYEKGNLLQLLELQLELEHIDQAHLAAIRPERLKHYIKILKGQLVDLDMEIERVEEQLAFDFGLSPFGRLHPKDLPLLVRQDVSSCRREIAELKRQLDTSADPKQLKGWLKGISLRRQRDPDFDFPF